MDTIKIVYLAGVVRSGTTIIDRSLGSLNDVTSFCEIRYVWQQGLQKNAYCSCGERSSDCFYWKSLARDLIKEGVDADKVIDLQNSVDRARHLSEGAGVTFREKRTRRGGLQSPVRV